MKKVNEFVEQCSRFKTKEELADFFDVILTISEREELPKRLEIVRELLLAKKTQREIAKYLKVSIANITRASNLIKSTKYDLKKMLGISKQ